MIPRRDDILRLLAEHRPELDRFGASSLSIFGSMARDEAGPESDIDILVEFSKPIGLFGFVRVQETLESVLKGQVDLVMRDAIIPQLRDRILAEEIRAG